MTHGFDADKVGLMDPRVDGARDAAWGVMSAAKAAGEKPCVHCADGNSLTAVVLADWLLTDYIGGDNYVEACDLLKARKRLSGVGREVEAVDLERWVADGHL